MNRRLAAGVEYDGRCYSGWQKQKHCIAIQSHVEAALSKVAGHPVGVTCAGRTDAGVHALGQVIHFDAQAERAARGWLLGANSNLPRDIALTWVEPVDARFHARFSAVGRRYRYLIHSGSARSAVWRGRVAECVHGLDHPVMQAAAESLIGRHDFSAFRARECQAHSPQRDLRELRVSGEGPWTVLDVEADGFLHHMVRNIAGVLIAIGAGRRKPAWAAEVLAGRDRARGGVTAPADGLYFVTASYPPDLALPRPPNLGFPL